MLSIPDGGRPGFGGRLLPTESALSPVEGEDGDFDVLAPLLGDITVTDSSDLLRLLDAIPSYVLVLRYYTIGLGPLIFFVCFFPSESSFMLIFNYRIVETFLWNKNII